MNKAASLMSVAIFASCLWCVNPASAQEETSTPEDKTAEPAKTSETPKSAKKPPVMKPLAATRKPHASVTPKLPQTKVAEPVQQAQPPGPASPAPATTPAPNGTASPAPEAIRVNPAGEYQPVIHARNNNITTCMDDIVTDSNDVIDRPHTAISTWVTAAPNEHAFESLIGLSNPSKLAPSSAAIIFTTPKAASKCEGMTVQVYPTVQPCGTVQASLIKAGRTIGALQSMPIIDTNDGARNMLLPNGSGGCVLVRTKIKAS